jgi:hypothetical protein
MTPEDRERLTKLAAKEKLSISDLIRKWIQETPLRERKRKEDETVSKYRQEDR